MVKVMSYVQHDFIDESELQELITFKDSVLEDFLVYDLRNVNLNVNNLEGHQHRRYADLLLIHKEFKFWMITEVEVSGHSIKSHIFPQIIELYTILYSNVKHIRSELIKKLNIKDQKIINLINRNIPFLCLIIDKIPSTHTKSFELFSSFCNVISINRFRNENQDYIYPRENYYISEIINNYSVCHCLKKHVFQIDHPNLIDLDSSKNISALEYENVDYPVNPNSILGYKVQLVNRFIIYCSKINVRPGKYYASVSQSKISLKK